jgi:Tfp pilus assembly protein PilO
MNMAHILRGWKVWIGLGLVLLLAVDIGLGVFLWKAAREGPQAMHQQRDRLALHAKLLKADVARGESIRTSLPQVGKDCDNFYHDQFLPASTGYSSVVSDLGAIAQKSAVRTSGVSFAQKEVKGRGVEEITIKATVQGGYLGLIQFVNGLERSKNFYLLDDLHLDSSNTGEIRLNLELRTYFRT